MVHASDGGVVVSLYVAGFSKSTVGMEEERRGVEERKRVFWERGEGEGKEWDGRGGGRGMDEIKEEGNEWD
jgi:hypothetical protein